MKSEFISKSEEYITKDGLTAGAASLVEDNSILMVVRSGILKHTIPVALNTLPVTLNQDMKAIRIAPAAGDTRFFLRLIQGFNQIFLDLWSKQGATVESLETAAIRATVVPCPPLIEQSAIAEFLDRETGKIDALVAEQERLIALLKEKRQAVISHAVTNRWDDVVYWKRTPNDDLKNYELSEGDLVLGMDRPWIAAGVRVAKLTASDVPSLLLQRTARISARSHVLTDLLELMLSSNFFISHFGPEMTGVSVPHISPDQIANFRMPIPPESEQADIVDYIREVQQQLDQLMTEAKRAIALLSERRAALISAAVTGKIDVRHHAASAQAEAA